MLHALRTLQRCSSATSQLPQSVVAVLCGLERAALQGEQPAAAAATATQAVNWYPSTWVSSCASASPANRRFSSTATPPGGPTGDGTSSSEDGSPPTSPASAPSPDEQRAVSHAAASSPWDDDGDDEVDVEQADGEQADGEDDDPEFRKLDRLMSEDRLTEAYELMEKMFPEVEGEPSLEEILAYDPEEEERKARREEAQAIEEELARRWVRIVDHLGRGYGTGKRKTSIARVWVREGHGKVTINKRPIDEYFRTIERRADVLAPLGVTGTMGEFDVWATVRGGGTMGQAQAVRLGIARAMQAFDPELRPMLRATGMVTRDPRIVERKKPGKAKARKSFQWVKR